ncbi:chromosome transmission fidelity protein 18 homolog isoform X2 [Bacillus rossius redtenbacheri]|uniref:chromosome transmission fidelity protein 18 homolog isoform X2 n=1 Tax=Bacillus rossius redtenbacheri TaxID=93214 RepID=UPI002FDD0174
MGDFPDPDEEFEMMYAEEMEVMQEMEDHYEPPRSSKRSLDFFSENSVTATELVAPETARASGLNDSLQEEQALVRIDSLVDGVTPLGSRSGVGSSAAVPPAAASPPQAVPGECEPDSRKRTVEDLFGDITDLDAEEIDAVFVKRRKPCPEKDTDEDLINKIVAGRKEAHDRMNAKRIFSNSQPVSSAAGCGISRRVPAWPFVAIVGGDGDRWYARLRSEEQVDKEIKEVGVQGKTIGLLTVSYETIWNAAQQILEKRLDREQVEADARLARDSGREAASGAEAQEETADLWVVKYKPRSYVDLLSEEVTNRTLLHWLKLWDKVVFNRERKVKQKHKEEPVKRDGRFQRKPQAVVNEELDEHGCPQQKMALLCGPPGLGKTTLAHMIATVAGYKPVEMNASDDRSPEAFRLQLESATQMRSVMGEQPRPNCLILDEIDGTPAAAIEVLVKFATGKDVGKGRGKKKAAGAGVLKRPIICICNDVYVPALRPLRQLALVVNFPPTASARLAQRLMEIARSERVRTDLTALLALADKAHNDIRTCLGVLQFFKTRGGEMKACDVRRSAVGQKDMQKGLFAVWQEIFQIQQPRQKPSGRQLPSIGALQQMAGHDYADVMHGDLSFASRMNNILKTVQGYGDYERLMQGVYENFLSLNVKDSTLRSVCIALDWFQYFDELNRQINTSQSYFLMPYIPFCFVAWHLLFASFAWPKITYPSVGYEMSVKDGRRRQSLAELMRGMCPSIRSCLQGDQLLLDTLPMMLHVLVPNLRPVNIQLYSAREKAELSQVVGIMVEYNLSYIQEKTPEGSYVYKLEPNVEELCSFPGLRPGRALSYANKQMLSREAELERMRRAEEKLAAMSIREGPAEGAQSGPTTRLGEEGRRLPNHLQCLVPKSVAPPRTVQCTDFFGRVVERAGAGDSAAHLDEIVKSDVWFHFKEGFSNAVRRTVKMRDLV